MTIACGFDPSISSLGLGVVERTASGYVLVWARTIRTQTSAPLTERCDVIVDALSLMIRTEQPSFLAIEDQQGVRAGKWKSREKDGEQMNSGNNKTLIVQGLAQATARIFRVPVVLVQPQTVKRAVLGPGGRSATKREVQEAIARLTGKRVAQDAADGAAACVAGHQRWAQGVRAA